MALVVAHRGASAAHPPGNTVEAFRAARALGADWVELDVRPTVDGALAVHHDAELPDGRTIADIVRSALPDWVPVLDQALDACAGMGVNVELKADCPPALRDAMVEAVVALLGSRAEPAEVLVTSFDLAVVDRVRALDPEVPTGLLALDLSADPDPLGLARDHGHSALNPWDPFVGPDLVERAHAAGLRLNVWTVDDPDRLRALAAMGVDGLITNVPDVARAVLAPSGG